MPVGRLPFAKRRSSSANILATDDEPKRQSFRVLPRAESSSALPHVSQEQWNSTDSQHTSLARESRLTRSSQSLFDSNTSYSSTLPSSVESHSIEDINARYNTLSQESRPQDEQASEEKARDRSFSIKAAARKFSLGSRKHEDTRQRSATVTSVVTRPSTSSVLQSSPPKLELAADPLPTTFSADLSAALAPPAIQEEDRRFSIDDSQEEKRLTRTLPIADSEALAVSRFLDRDYSQPFVYSASSGSFIDKKAPPASTIARMGKATTTATSTIDAQDDNLFDKPRVPKQQQYQNRFFSSWGRNNGKVKTPQTSKRMTKAEFEQAQASTPAKEGEDQSDSKSDTSEESINYDDEDDNQRDRHLAIQRRRQEAQLAVYRQQMAKVTGEQVSELPTIPRASVSTPNLLSRSSLHLGPRFETIDLNASPVQPLQQTTAAEEEDDDVPLGVLQAHGFPNKHRPPTRLSMAASAYGALPSEQRAYPSPSNATRNDPLAGGGGSTSLPPFARNLPMDPYVGASLVNQSSREMLRPTTAGGSGTSLAPPPGGLVSIIATEERAKAMRRGNYEAPLQRPHSRIGLINNIGPNGYTQPSPIENGIVPTSMLPMQQAPYGQSAYAQAPFGQSPYGPQGAPSMSPTDPMAQMQMMQMQMQWMQQMMAMYQMQGLPVPPQMQALEQQRPMMPSQSRPQSAHMIGRPMSVFSSRQSVYQPSPAFLGAGAGAGAGAGQPFGQTMRPPSMFNASFNPVGFNPNQAAPGIGPGPAYTPSIAPSERSNIGQPSRYRPVSVYPSSESVPRLSTLSPGLSAAEQRMSMLPGAPVDLRASDPRASVMQRSPDPSRLSVAQPQPQHPLKQKTSMRLLGRSKKTTPVQDEDEDDDKAWAQMSKKKEERRSRWRFTRASRSFGTSKEGGLAEGLYAVDKPLDSSEA